MGVRVEQGERLMGGRTSAEWARRAGLRQRRWANGAVPPLALLGLLSACTTGPLSFLGGGQSGQNASQTAATGTPETLAPAAAAQSKVALLLPLSGPNGSLGDGMMRAARLALDAPGAPAVDPHDTAAPGGAAAAAQAAARNGDTIMLGPLTSAETAAVAPVAQGANMPVLAFTSDLAQARPGVWVMGVTPEQQVRRLVLAAKAEGRTRIAALLPSSPLGQAMADGLTRACADAGLPPPTMLTHGGTMDSINSAMRQLSAYESRHAAVTQAAAAGAPETPPAQPAPDAAAPGATPAPAAAAAPPPSQPMPPPPFDALLLADTGVQLQEVISVLKFYDVSAPQVRIMGPGLWGAFASKLRALAGAWYAAPDPSARAGFLQQYQARYHQSPKLLADLAYDAAAVARNLSGNGYDAASLTRPDGFAGVDGVFALRPDGHVRRGLAIFQIQPGGGGTIVQPAPTSLSDSTS
jgi:ABC-type branched-subunit amino acid transport system substrate-binding protein